MRISHATQDGGTAYEHNIPQFGLGVFLMSEAGECKSSVLNALNAGYTHIDTARAYNNEHEVGEAIREAAIDRERSLLRQNYVVLMLLGIMKQSNIAKSH